MARQSLMDAETTPAFMDFKLVFKATDERVVYEDAKKQQRSCTPLRQEKTGRVSAG
jgi:hypothetical protein